AAQLQRQSGQDRCLPRGPRLPDRGADRTVRSHMRGAVVSGGDRIGRRDDRPLRRSRAWRLLLHARRRRSADSAALGLLRLAQLSGSEEYERQAVSVMRLVYEIAPRHPAAFAHLLQAMHWYFAPARPIACAIPGRPSTAPPAAARQGGGS